MASPNSLWHIDGNHKLIRYIYTCYRVNGTCIALFQTSYNMAMHEICGKRPVYLCGLDMSHSL